MNLATRCSTCGTLFRVVPDQLRVSDGWVRCGRCQAVFSALESLLDLEGDPLPGDLTDQPSAPRSEDRPASRASSATPSGSSFPDRPIDAAAPLEADRIRAGYPAPFESGAVELPVTPDLRTDLDRVAFSATRIALPGEPSFAPSTPTGTLQSDRVRTTPASPPSFAVDATEAGRRSFTSPRRRPTARVAVALGLAALLGVQALLHARDPVAARWPALQPALAASCALLGCRLELPRSIDDIAVENTGLVKTALPGAFKLSVGLRHRGAVALALPSVELSLTNSRGQLIARRVLAPKEFDRAPDAIRPGADTVLQALLATPDLTVSGYTVEIFYP